jgi:hypothetical protein
MLSLALQLRYLRVKRVYLRIDLSKLDCLECLLGLVGIRLRLG